MKTKFSALCVAFFAISTVANAAVVRIDTNGYMTGLGTDPEFQNLIGTDVSFSMTFDTTLQLDPRPFITGTYTEYSASVSIGGTPITSPTRLSVATMPGNGFEGYTYRFNYDSDHIVNGYHLHRIGLSIETGVLGGSYLGGPPLLEIPNPIPSDEISRIGIYGYLRPTTPGSFGTTHFFRASVNSISFTDVPNPGSPFVDPFSSPPNVSAVPLPPAALLGGASFLLLGFAGRRRNRS